MDYDLGYVDLEEKTLQPLENPFGPKVLPIVFRNKLLPMSPGRTIENVVARDGIEPPTPAFSGLRSTD